MRKGSVLTKVDAAPIMAPAARRRKPRVRPFVLPADILATKLSIPQTRPDRVRRGRLAARLDAGLAHTLTLVCAPAGFGKTTLLCEWIQQREAAAPGVTVSWLSLDTGDDDPVRFLRYLAAALYRATPRASAAVLAVLQSPPTSSLHALLGVLVNELARFSEEFLLILDDYHVLRDRAVHEAVTFLIDHAPRNFHLWIATREEPPLPLARLRARDAVTELRHGDLRFTAAETTVFLERVMGLTISAEDVRTLETQTEGWVTGLQLAGLSMQGRADLRGFLAAFSGSQRYILDYLAEEVLGRQPEVVQEFLMRTAILDRLCGPLCDAVADLPQTGGGTPAPFSASHGVLDYVERANLFLVPLDAERRWYRYHPLFATLLRLRLRQTRSALLPELHRRASAWYEQAGQPIEAIRHALAGADVAGAARLLANQRPEFVVRGESRLLLEWLDALPADVRRQYPHLVRLHVTALAITHDVSGAERRVHDIEHTLLPTLPAAEAVVVRGWVLGLRSFIAHYVGDTERAAALAREALPLLPATEMIYPATLVRTAIDFLISGDVGSAAEQRVAALAGRDATPGDPEQTVRKIALLARLHVMQGRLRQAAAVYARAAWLVPGSSAADVLIGGMAYHVGLGAVLLEQNELEAAERLIAKGIDAISDTTFILPGDMLLGFSALARVRQARGDPLGALAVMGSFMDIARLRRFVPAVMAQAAAGLARLRLWQGDLTGATRWAEESGLETGGVPRYAQEDEYLTLARVQIAQGAAAETLGWLGSMLEHAETAGRRGSVLEISVVQALALAAVGQADAAVAALARALALGAPEGYVRVFADEGTSIAALLRRSVPRGRVPGYAARLLSVIHEAQRPDAASAVAPNDRRAGVLTEPLTAREREVLVLLAEGASNQDIARRFVVTVGTVKTHVHNILGKLAARNRTQAIFTARDLKLL